MQSSASTAASCYNTVKNSVATVFLCSSNGMLGTQRLVVILTFHCRMLSNSQVSATGKRLAPNAMPRAIFEKDVDDTYEMICTRAAKAKEEDALAGRHEAIQLQCENPDTDVQFNVPDGPPPEEIVLEGE